MLTKYANAKKQHMNDLKLTGALQARLLWVHRVSDKLDLLKLSGFSTPNNIQSYVCRLGKARQTENKWIV